MCQMRIVLKQGEREEVVLENAALLKVTAEGILVNAMFEPPKLIPDASVSVIDFLENKVTLAAGRKQVSARLGASDSTSRHRI